MTNLFSKKIILEDLKNFSIHNIEEKIGVVQSRVNIIKSGTINQKTETECEQAFNHDIFGKVLDYRFFPCDIYTLEPKGKNSISGQKADAVLGIFSAQNIQENTKLVQAVVEIKDAKTPLEKSQKREGNLSPIQQGFKYKPQYPVCKWVIVTNFVEIRLFKDNMLDYEIWKLVDLVDEKNDFENFRIFYHILSEKKFISNSISNTEKLLSQVRIQTEKITKKFYQEYKNLRLELINDILKNNQIQTQLAIEKSQKIIDRMVFIFFCEDRNLLPNGKTADYVKKARELDFEPWELLKKVFNGVNSGSKMLGIPNGYNGGLFHEDEILNGLKISDDICFKFLDLGKYDFEQELSVNILGHIFEQSISDIENLKIDMVGTEIETENIGEKGNKRKKDGIFYTPEYIVDYIVKNSLGKYLEEKFSELEKSFGDITKLTDKHYEEKNKKLYFEYQKILENIKVLDPACGSGAFLVKVFDYLLQEHKRVGEQLGTLFDTESLYKSILQNNIFGVDLNAESVEITKLSLWLKTAEKDKKLASLDNNIKCGNSLIDDEKVAGKKAFVWEKEFGEIMKNGGFDVIVGNPPYVVVNKTNDYKNYERNTDLYLMFFEKSLKNLLNKQNFYFGFITPKFYLVNKISKSLREYFLKNVNLLELIDSSPFEDANTECVITIIKSGKPIDNLILGNDNNGNIQHLGNISKSNFLDKYDYLINISISNLDLELLKKIEIKSNLLGSIVQSKRGMEIGKNDLRKLNSGRKTLIGQDIDKYSLSFENTFIDENFKDYIRLKEFFNGEKIYLRRVSKNLIGFLGSDFSFNKNIYGLKSMNEKFDLKYILCLLNSKLLSFYYLKKFSTKKGDLFPEIQTYLYEQLPIKNISLEEQKPFIELAGKMLELNKNLSEKTQNFLNFLSQKFGLEKINTKLQKFYDLEFGEFLKSLGKKIPLDIEYEIMNFFEKQKSEILALKSQIQQTDKIIDEKVFELYGLTDEEKKIVLES